jgi:hypothetical protein
MVTVSMRVLRHEVKLVYNALRILPVEHGVYQSENLSGQEGGPCPRSSATLNYGMSLNLGTI